MESNASGRLQAHNANPRSLNTGCPLIGNAAMRRRAFHAAARNWVLAGLAAGHIAISDVKNGPPATRALSGRAISPFPKHEGPPPRPLGQGCPSDDFGRVLDEMDGILGEPTIPLQIRLHWLARDR